MRFETLAAVERELANRNYLLHRAHYDHETGSLSPDGVVVAGLCGHHFIADGRNGWEKRFTGEIVFSSDGIAYWLNLLQARQEMARQLGMILVNLVAPEKQSVLPQFRWQYGAPATSERRPIRQLLAQGAERHGLYFPADMLMKHGIESELYYRGNSHWCASAVVLTAQEVAARLGIADLPVERIRYERRCLIHDLLYHYSTEEPFEESIFIAPHCESVDGGLGAKNSRLIRNPDARSQDKLVIFCDSYTYSFGLDHVLALHFAEVHVLWSKDVDWAYVDSIGAKHILWESAERFLITLPRS